MINKGTYFSIFHLLPDCFISWITEKSEGNGLKLELWFMDKSLRKIREVIGPKIEPWGTAVELFDQLECLLLKTALGFRSFMKLIKVFNE